MIASDVGFSVENYVGTYEIVDDKGNRRIVSKEFHPARGEEKGLEKKTLYVDDFKTNEYLLVDLANVDIGKESSILAFCDKYGLPYSSAKIFDEHRTYSIMGLNVDEATYSQVDPYCRQDTMSVFEFCRHASSAKRILCVWNEIESQNRNPRNMLQHLFPLVFYEREALYEYNEDDPTRHTLTTRFQYYYLTVINKRCSKEADKNLSCKLLDFCAEILDIEKGKNKVYLDEDFTDLLHTEHANDLYRFAWEIMKLSSEQLNEFKLDEYNNLQLPDELSISKELEEIMYEIAPVVMADTITEGLFNVHPSMIIKPDKSFAVDWKFNYQYEGFMMELMLMITSNNLLKKCANPTCEKFFSISTAHRDKMYCSERCGQLMAKRRQRIRDKENPDRERLEPGFKNRKKKQE